MTFTAGGSGAGAEQSESGLGNLLVHSHRARSGRPEFRDALAVADQVKGQLSGEIAPGMAEYVEPETLLKRVIAGLNSISFEPGKRTPLVMGLSDALIGDTTGRKAAVKVQEVPEGKTTEALGLEGLLPDRSRASRPRTKVRAVWVARSARTTSPSATGWR
jgi:hypothetical protein